MCSRPQLGQPTNGSQAFPVQIRFHSPGAGLGPDPCLNLILAAALGSAMVVKTNTLGIRRTASP